MSAAASPFRLELDVDFAPLREAFAAAGYEREALAARVGLDGPRMELSRAAGLQRTSGGTPFETLARVFLLAHAEPVARVRAALAPMPLEPLLELGLLQPLGDDALVGAVTLLTHDGLLVAHDVDPRLHGDPGPLPDAHVVGAGLASLSLARLTPRRAVDLALDIGTGSGVQALLAARHAGRVLATDTNPRALAFTELGARLNGLHGVETRRGAFYEPVADERVDLLVANPPFLVSPDGGREFTGGGSGGDGIAERLVREACARLLPGGWASVVFDWHHADEPSWAERPLAWLDGQPCDAWLLRLDAKDPLGYAADWLRFLRPTSAAAYARDLEHWVAHYQRAGIGRFSFGGLVLRRRADGQGAGWRRAGELAGMSALGDAGEQLQRVFEAEDLLRHADGPAALLAARLQLVPEHGLSQALRAGESGWDLLEARIRLREGLRLGYAVDGLAGALLLACDGQRPLQALLAALESAHGAPPGGLREPVLAAATTALRHGVLAVREEAP